MVADTADILYDDSDTMDGASPVPDGVPQTHAKRGRGRPKGARSRARAVGSGATTTPGATPSPAGTRALASGLAKGIGVLSVVVAQWALAMPEAALTPAEANDIAKPAARLLAKTAIGQWIIRMLTGSAMGGDAGKLAWALMLYGWRIAPLVQLRYQQLELQRQAQKGRPYGTGHTGEDARVWAAQPQQTADRPIGANPAASAGAAGASDDAAARAAADAARFGGLGFANPDALAAGAYGDVAANIRASSQQ